MGFQIDKLLQKAFKGQLLSEQSIAIIVLRLKELFVNQPNVVQVDVPVNCVGDIHGQFYDLLEIFNVGGNPPYASYLFMGDYVDRGSMSVQVITLLCLLKLKYPERVFLLRGNHQTRSTTQTYGFYFQCQTKFSKVIVWQLFTELFDYFPIAAKVGNQIFAVHGGLSPAIQYVDQITHLDRFAQIPHSGAFADLVWSDPATQQKIGFIISSRGAGYNFGQEVLNKFLHLNHFKHLTRAHQLCQQGYQLLFDGKLSTVWSAPNYLASVMEVSEEGERSFNVFSESPQNLLNKYGPIQTNLGGAASGFRQSYFM